MSIKIMTKVWDESTKKGSTLLLLLAIADHADDNGFCWPGIARLAHKIRMSPQSVMRKVQELERDGELAVVRQQGEHNWYVIRIRLTDAEVQEIFAKRDLEWTSDKLTPVSHVIPPPTTCDTSPVSELCNPNLHEPSVNRQSPPDGGRRSSQQEQEPVGDGTLVDPGRLPRVPASTQTAKATINTTLTYLIYFS